MPQATSEAIERLGEILRDRLEPSRGQRPGRPCDPRCVIQRKISMAESTFQWLQTIAVEVSSDERRVSPMQVAAILLETAVQDTRSAGMEIEAVR